MRLFVRLKYKRYRTCALVLLACACTACLYVLGRQRGSVLRPGELESALDPGPAPAARYVPGKFLEGNAPANTSYCQFNYHLPQELRYGPADESYTPELGARSPYRVLYNVVQGVGNATGALTYCSHVTPHFVYHVAEIARYWDAPLSVAAFVPDVDADVTVQLLRQLCHCFPGMDRVSVHFVYPRNRPPYVRPATGAPHCTLPDITDLKTYRTRENLPYPVNACRNVARQAAHTAHVLVSDIELVPSEDLPRLFANMLRRFRILSVPMNRVFVVPVFEVESHIFVPRTKTQLKRLYDEEKAVYFHRWVCVHCQKFPGLVKWLNSPDTGAMRPFMVTKREEPFHRWEPIHISTHKEPLYSETLSWEGQQDKMTQMVEMCLMGYKFVILDGAFLVHWPGIKRRTSESKVRNAWRKPHQRHNTRQYEVIINQLASKYTENERCKLQ